MKTLNEIALELYGINAHIRFYWIDMQKMPTQNEIVALHKRLGLIIKDLRGDD